MRLPVSVPLLFSLMPLVAQEPSAPADARGWINKGVAEFKAAQYPSAVEAFQKAVALNPNDISAHVYLGTALMSQYIPGAASPDNLEMVSKAESEFRHVLQAEPGNATALQSLATMMYQMAQGMPDADERLRKLGEAASWYEKLIEADPQNSVAYYSLGVIDWQRWYAAWMSMRTGLGMKPEAPGPLPDPARKVLKEHYSSMIEHGISNLEKALQIDPLYPDAMAYMNLLIRERADLADSPGEYRNEIGIADQWVQKALDARATQLRTVAEVPPPPPASPNATSQRIRVGENVQAANLIRKVQPIYPQAALDARIQGVVRFTAIIGRDGTIQSLQLVSGHPMLAEPARDAVGQWQYKPTLLNGSPVEVVTNIAVNFTLP